MSALSDLDSMVLRQLVYPPLAAKNAELTFAEWDQRIIDIYRVVQDLVDGSNVDAYDPAKTYDGTSSDVYEKFAGYDSRIWQAVFAGTFSGETPAEGIYWTQVTLAQMLPNVLKLAEIGSGAAKSVELHTQNIAAAAMLTGNTTPIPVTITRPSGQTITPLFPILGSLVFNSVSFATNTVIGLRYVGADVPIATCDLLGRTASGTVNFVPVTTVGAGQSQYLGNADLEIYVLTGDPTAGNSVTATSFTFIRQ